MDKNTITILVVLGVILIVFFFWQSSQQAKRDAQNQQMMMMIASGQGQQSNNWLDSLTGVFGWLGTLFGSKDDEQPSSGEGGTDSPEGGSARYSNGSDTRRSNPINMQVEQDYFNS